MRKLGLAILVVAGCQGGGSTTGKATPASTASTSASTTSQAVTTPAPPPAPAAPAVDTARQDALRAIVKDFTASGDERAALAALAQRSATPEELVALLRGPRKLEGTLTGGHRTLEITDGFGRKTDLQVVAPTVAQIQARAAKGLGLVVMLHGINGSGSGLVDLGKELAAGGDVVAVAPSAQPLPPGFGPEDGIPAAFAQQFKTWWTYEPKRSFALESVRVACSLYPIDPERVVLCGASMGGYGAWNVGLRHPDRYAAIAPICGGLSRLGHTGMSDPKSNALLANGLMFPVWAAHGDQDTVVPYAPDKQAADTLKGMGGDVTFRTLAGVGHDVKPHLIGNGTLAAELRAFVTTKRRKQAVSLSYLSGGESLDGAHWLRIVTRGGGSKLQGSIDRATNTITVSGDVSRARVYVDDRILDLSKPVTIKVGGSVRYSAQVKTSLSAVLQSWRSREDEGLVYSAGVELDPR